MDYGPNPLVSPTPRVITEPQLSIERLSPKQRTPGNNPIFGLEYAGSGRESYGGNYS